MYMYTFYGLSRGCYIYIEHLTRYVILFNIYAGLMLAQRSRRWPGIKSTLIPAVIARAKYWNRDLDK